MQDQTNKNTDVLMLACISLGNSRSIDRRDTGMHTMYDDEVLVPVVWHSVYNCIIKPWEVPVGKGWGEDPVQIVGKNYHLGT